MAAQCRVSLKSLLSYLSQCLKCPHLINSLAEGLVSPGGILF